MRFTAKPAQKEPPQELKTRQIEPGERPDPATALSRLTLPPTEPPVDAPFEWASTWNEFQQMRWSGYTNAERREFIAFHSTVNLCVHCHKLLPYIPCPSTGNGKSIIRRPTVCDPCWDIHHKRKAQGPLPTWWDLNCPEAFKASNINLVPNRPATEKVLEWQPGAKGLILHGVTGRAKTRTVWMLLNRLSSDRKRKLTFAAFDATKWGDECARKFEDKSVYPWLEVHAAVDVFFLDDIDKAVFTERVQAELFLVFKVRCEEGKPTIFTTNLTDRQLKEKFEAERGAAFMERVYEYCEPVKF